MKSNGRNAHKQLWKFPIPIRDDVTITMPKGAIVRAVMVQRDTPCIWAEVDAQAPPVDRRFFIIGTGHPMPVDATQFVGSFMIEGGSLVFHVYEDMQTN